MKIATFNVNSINKRYELVQNWANSNNIDILCLQELKTTKTFSLLNECFISNQKQFNGVATCSVFQITKTKVIEPARAIYTQIENLDIINIYAPLGDLYMEKFEYKMQF
ncbi:MAG: exodeoxyribonuclease III, partial [Epsilonproteobacteria bacterium]|nr:exodeoxyribonuclease III [Campylobacterota bacterium]